jgi:competence protein ComEA
MDDRKNGFLSLLLILSIIFALKTAAAHSGPMGVPFAERSFIEIRGDVRLPGVYVFGHSPHLMELIGRAGGLSPGAVLPESFEDRALSTGTSMVVRGHGQGCRLYEREMPSFYKLTLGIPISLNRESEEGLTAIPGIGPALAKAIVLERTQRGGFKTLDEILSIRGISKKLFGRIRPYVML